MSDQQDFDQELTPIHEYIIATVVISLFALMYLFFMREDEPLSILEKDASHVTEIVNKTTSVKPIPTDTVEVNNTRKNEIETRRKLDIASRLKNEETNQQAHQLRLLADKKAQVEAEARKAAAAERLKIEAEARKAAAAERLKIEAEARNAAAAERLKIEAEARKAAAAERLKIEAEARKAAAAERLKIEAKKETSRQKELARLDFTLPDGRNITIPSNGFENKLKYAILNNTKNQAIVFDRVYFNSGFAVINSQSTEQILATAGILNTYQDINIILRGHTDNTGKKMNNLILSLNRSKNLKNQLVALGITANRINTEGVGSLEPIARNRTKSGRAKNRRIDLFILDN